MQEDQPRLPRWYVVGARIINAGLLATALGAAAVVAVAVSNILGL